MKKFILDIIKYIIVFGLFMVVISSAIFSFRNDDTVGYYETDLFVKKYNFIKENPKEFDTLFFGSSLTRSGIVPEYFDELNKGESNSFNLGVDGIRLYRMSNFVDLITKDNSSIKTVFFELRTPMRGSGIDKENPERYNHIFYTATPDNFLLDIDYAFKKDWVKSLRDSFISSRFNELTYKYSGVGIDKHILLLLGLGDGLREYRFRKDFLDNDGFEFKDYDSGDVELGTKNSRFDRRSKKSVDEIFRLINKNKKTYLEFYSDKSTHERFNIIDELERVADKVASRGIDFYFVLLPLPDFPYELLIIKESLLQDGYSVIDIADPDRYPEVYEIKNVRDNHHLNKEGAEINTGNLFKQYQIEKRL